MEFKLEAAVGRTRLGCDGVRWQDETTRRANAREEEQRRQRSSIGGVALSQMVNVVGSKNTRFHVGLPKKASGQLPNLGSMHVKARRQRYHRNTQDQPEDMPGRLNGSHMLL